MLYEKLKVPFGTLYECNGLIDVLKRFKFLINKNNLFLGTRYDNSMELLSVVGFQV